VKIAKQLAIVLGLTVFVSGCAGSSKLKQDVNVLKTQVGALATQLNRLAEETRYTQDALITEEQNRKQLEADVQTISVGSTSTQAASNTSSGVYTTPSGFQLRGTEIQEALRNAGYYNGPVDGKIGSGSVDAIRRFQADHGLGVDGVVGRNTWSKLKVYSDTAVK